MLSIESTMLLCEAYAKQLDASIVKRIDTLKTLHGNVTPAIYSTDVTSLCFNETKYLKMYWTKFSALFDICVGIINLTFVLC